LLTLKRGDISLNRFSPTGFPSSAVNNSFLRELQNRSSRQVTFSKNKDDVYIEVFNMPYEVFLRKDDIVDVQKWINDGFSVPLITPSQTLIFVTHEQDLEIKQNRSKCIGCISSCRFSGWSQECDKQQITPDPRLFCIQKSLQEIVINGDVDNALMFCGHQGYRFAEDPFYDNGFIPTVKELVERICTGQ
jgi:hypothetical protein